MNPSAIASYLATFKMLVTLLNPWNLIYLDIFVQIPQHVLFRLLPPVKATGYNLRQRSHHLPPPPNVVQGQLLGSFTLLSVRLFSCSHLYVIANVNFVHVTALSTVMFCVCQNMPPPHRAETLSDAVV